MDLQQKLRDAAEHPDNWDMPGLLNDAAAQLDEFVLFLRSFLNPEELGRAVPGHVRDDVREFLGMKRCE
jgi:hypothetical protein